MSNLNINAAKQQSPTHSTEQKNFVDKQAQDEFESAMEDGQENTRQNMDESKSNTTSTTKRETLLDTDILKMLAQPKQDPLLDTELLKQKAELDAELINNKNKLNTESLKQTGNPATELDNNLDTSQSTKTEMQAMLGGQQSLMSQMQTTPNSLNVSSDHTLTAETQDLANKLVERILVSNSDAKQQEVHIKVSSDILSNTEITLKRNMHGHLQVTLITDDAKSWQTLVQGQQSLRELLNKNESNTIVRVQNTAENQAENNDSQRRSRTFTEATSEENKG